MAYGLNRINSDFDIVHKMKVIRSDNGGEFVNLKFKETIDKCGIKYQTTQYTPQQNEIAERYNRTFIEKARCMLINAGRSSFYGSLHH